MGEDGMSHPVSRPVGQKMPARPLRFCTVTVQNAAPRRITLSYEALAAAQSRLVVLASAGARSGAGGFLAAQQRDTPRRVIRERGRTRLFHGHCARLKNLGNTVEQIVTGSI